MNIKRLITAFIFLLSVPAVYAQSGSSSLQVELESLTGQGSFSPFNVEFDGSASGGQYVAWPNNGNQILSSPSDGATGQVEILFTLSQTANVQFQVRANMPNANDDSFYYKLDAGAWNTQNNTTTSGWGTLTPATFNNLPAGDHTLRIQRREDGAGLDQVTLTASAGEIAGGGGGGGHTIVVRALGTTGTESITLRVGGTDVQSWTLSTDMMDYTATTSLNGDVTVAFTNDDGNADVRIDYVQVNGQTRQAENQSENTGAWGNNQCGGGSNTEWLHCNGHINFGPVSGTNPNPAPGFFVGNITTGGQVRSDFMQYWDQITPENEGKWGSVEGTRDQYNWSGLDAVYNFAQQNGIPFKQHTLVWGSQAPGWINNLSPSEQAAEIEEWIRDFCARYPNTQMIDVVNEATPGHAPAGYAQSAFGNDWIIRSFQLARQYCPNAILILNDYNVLSWNTQEFIDMATPAINAGVVDAISLQAHGLENWSLNDIQSKLDAVAALGLPIYISEYDVNSTNDQTQLQIMQEQFPMFFAHPSVAGITLWGYVVGQTWRDGTGLIQSNGTPRPAMTWLMNYLGR